MAEKIILAIFPYITTDKKVNIRGLDLYSSDNINFLPTQIKNYLKRIFKMFFLKDNYRIKNMIYTYLEVDEYDFDKQTLFINQLRNIQTLLRFIYSATDPKSLETFLSKEHCNFYLFYPEYVSDYLIKFNKKFTTNVGNDVYKEKEKAQGFRVEINSKNTYNNMFWVINESRIYPPQGQFVLKNPDLSRDIKIFKENKPEISVLLEPKENHYKIDFRIFEALKWYNRSNSYNIEDENSLLNLAISLECLLNLKQGNQVTKRFKEVVSLLVGPIPKLDEWLDQFYKARSAIVHEGRTYRTEYITGGSKYRSLTSYGRKIFEICLTGIVSGSRLAIKMDLSSLFTTNYQRFQKICKEIDMNLEYIEPEELILSLKNEILNIDKYRSVQENNMEGRTILSCGKKIIKAFLMTDPEIDKDLKKLMKKFKESKNDKCKIKMLEDLYNYIVEEKIIGSFDSNNVFHLVILLIKNVLSYKHLIEYYLKYNK